MSENVYQNGNTVRLQCTFTDFDGTNKDPNLIKVTIYDQTYTQVNQTILGSGNRIASGNYFFDYTIPPGMNQERYYYEWYGEFSGVPALRRNSFKATFI